MHHLPRWIKLYFCKMSRTQCVLLLVALFVGLAHSWDVAISTEDRLEFYTDEIKIDTVRFDSQNLTALVYDEVHNMLLYVDKQSENDTICGYNIALVEFRCYIERNGRNIQGLAFDPLTRMLFFTDTKERSINWIAIKPGYRNSVYGNLLIKMDDGIPTDIAVDSCSGYIYWINTNLTTPTIERARYYGVERRVIFRSDKYKLDPHSLAIDQQTQKIYWIMPKTSTTSFIYSADLNGSNNKSLVVLTFDSDHREIPHPNTLAVSKKFLWSVNWCTSCRPNIFRRYPMPTIQHFDGNGIFEVYTGSVIGIAANYKISEQFQGLADCQELEILIPTRDAFKLARESEAPFCEHGIKVIGQSLCKCTPGYTGNRCDVSVCENFCLQGNCSINEEDLPGCRCDEGYSGERCEIDVCHGHCLNNGTCSVNLDNEPVCECIDDNAGERCDVPVYRTTGDCSLKEEGSR